MSYSQIITDWVTDYEMEHGRKPSEKVLHIAEHIGMVGERLVELGRKDRINGKIAFSTAVFRKLVRHHFTIEDSDREDELMSNIAAIWQADYMDGYNERKEG